MFVSERLYNDNWYLIFNHYFVLRQGATLDKGIVAWWQQKMPSNLANVIGFQPVGGNRYVIQCQPRESYGDFYLVLFSVSPLSNFGGSRFNCSISCQLFSVWGTKSIYELTNVLKRMTAELMIRLGENDETQRFIKNMSREELAFLLSEASERNKVEGYLQTTMPEFYKEMEREAIAAEDEIIEMLGTELGE